MLQIPPQKIPQNFRDILSVVPSAMPQLQPKGPPGEEIPSSDFLRAIDEIVPSGPTRNCLHAAVYLLCGDLDHCHRLCQQVPTPLGSAWHAAMHRQEGDFWNSKYWWRRASGLTWSVLGPELQSLLAGLPPDAAPIFKPIMRSYAPAHFVDPVEAHANTPGLAPILVDIQRWEWAVLFLQTCERKS